MNEEDLPLMYFNLGWVSLHQQIFETCCIITVISLIR